MAPSAVETAKKHLANYLSPIRSPHVRAVLRDSDGQWFLNYLDAVLVAEDEHGPYFEKLLEHKSVVEAKLAQYQPVPLIWSKYAWVAGYHNYFCDSNNNWFDDTHKIDLDLFRAAPSSIAT